jgi:hypothetical protein
MYRDNSCNLVTPAGIDFVHPLITTFTIATSTSPKHYRLYADDNFQYPTYTPSSLSALSVFSASPPHSPNAAANTPSSDPAVLSTEPAPTSSTDTELGSDPPSQPPPSVPPPLNIPPSRARRQLQARLALSKEKADREAADHELGNSPTGSPVASPTESEGKPPGIVTTTTTSASESLDELLRKAKSGAGGVEEAASEAIRRVDEERKKAQKAPTTGERAVPSPGQSISTTKDSSPPKPKARPARPGMGMRGDSGLPQAVRTSAEGAIVPRLEKPKEASGGGSTSEDNYGGDREGEEVPLKISTSPRTSEGMMGRVKALFGAGKSSENRDEMNSSEEDVEKDVAHAETGDKPQGLKVNKATKRTRLDE